MDAAVTALTPANQAAMLAEATPDTPRGPLGRLQALPARKRSGARCSMRAVSSCPWPVWRWTLICPPANR